MHLKNLLSGVFTILIAFPLSAGGATYHITADGTGDFPTIQEAISAAAETVENDTIRVGPGTYIDLHKDPYYSYNNMILSPGIRVESTNGPEATILDAHIDAITHPELSEGTTTRAAFMSDCDENTVLSGFTIRGGHDALSSSAGVLIEGGSPRIENCFFDDLYGGRGGSILISSLFGHEVGQPVITGCTFYRSFTCCGMGGAISAEGGSPQILNNTFDGDSTQFQGAAIAVVNAAGVVSGNLFRGNKAVNGGGAIVVAYGASPEIAGNTFIDNEGVGGGGSGNGGAVAYIGGATGSFHDNVIIGNSSDAAGGAIFIDSASPEIARCTILGNSGAGTGAIHITDAGGYGYPAEPSFQSVLVASNGGTAGVRVEGTATPTFTGSNFFGNQGGEFVGMTSPVGNDGNQSVDPYVCADPTQGLQECSPFVFNGRVFGVPVPFCPCTTTGAQVNVSWGALRARMSPVR